MAKLTREDAERLVKEAHEKGEVPDLSGVDLSRVDLSRVDLSGAWYDEHTKWPPGFDPKLAGVNLVESQTVAVATQSQGCVLTLPLIFAAAIAVVLVGMVGLFTLPGASDNGPTPTPIIAVIIPTHTSTPPGTPTPTPSTTSPRLEIAENTSVEESDILGQININYPVRMSPKSSDTIIVSIRIPLLLASLEPMDIEIVTIPADIPPVIGARGSDEKTIRIKGRMRVEVVAPAFLVGKIEEQTQLVNTEEINAPTFWTWTLVAPDAAGSHNFVVSVYLADEPQASWHGVYQVNVEDFTPTPTPTPTNTPSIPPTVTPTPVPFLDTPSGTAFIGAGATLMAAVVGVIGVIIAKDRLPVIGTKASYRRRLETKRKTLNHLKEQIAIYPVGEVPVSKLNQIESLEQEIAELKEKLKK